MLEDPQDPTVVWQRLEGHFQKTWANKLALRRRLYSLKLGERDSTQDHIKRITEMFGELSVVGHEISNEDQVVHLLASLSESYNVFVTALDEEKTQKEC